MPNTLAMSASPPLESTVLVMKCRIISYRLTMNLALDMRDIETKISFIKLNKLMPNLHRQQIYALVILEICLYYIRKILNIHG